MHPVIEQNARAMHMIGCETTQQPCLTIGTQYLWFDDPESTVVRAVERIYSQRSGVKHSSIHC